MISLQETSNTKIPLQETFLSVALIMLVVGFLWIMLLDLETVLYHYK